MDQDKKVHNCKSRNKDDCERACKREHNRLQKQNDQYRKIRSLLGLEPKTTKVDTLVAAIRYIKMMTNVVETAEGAASTDGTVPAEEFGVTNIPETVEELEQKYTLRDEFRASLPEEMRSLSIPELVQEMPYILKILEPTSQMQTTDGSNGQCSVPEDGTSSSCALMQIESDGCENAAVHEDHELPPNDQPNVRTIQYSSTDNILNVESDSVEIISKDREGHECFMRTNNIQDVEVELPSFQSLLDALKLSAKVDPSPGVFQEPEPMEVDGPLPTEPERNLKEETAKGDSFPCVVHEPEPMEVDDPLPTEPERNLEEKTAIGDHSPGVVQEPETMEVDDPLPDEHGTYSEEDTQEWLGNNLLEDELIFNHEDRLIYLDTNSMDVDEMKDFDT